MTSTNTLARFALATAVVLSINFSLVYANCGSCSSEQESETKGSGSKAKAGSGSKQCTASLCALSGEKPTGSEARLTPHALNAMIATKQDITILDARGEGSTGGRIMGAKQITHKASPSEIAKVIPSKDALVVTYCGSAKCTLSNKLATRLKTLGYKHVIELPAGIAGWTEAELPVDSKG